LEIKKHRPNPTNLAIDRQKLVFDADAKKEFLNWLKNREDKIQTMLLWCSIAVLVSYASVMLVIVKIYASLNIGQPLYLLILAAVIFCLFGLFVRLQYHINTYTPTGTKLVIKELLYFKAHIARRQMILLAGYIATYSVFVIAACALCYDALWGAQKILRVTAPVSILIYAAGLFLLLKLAGKRRTYLNYITTIDDSIVKGFSNQ
jgi:hypothetical protein